MSTRNYGIDFGKIISMFMVVVLHILGHGGILNNVVSLSINDIFAWFLEILCYPAVNLFALTTGYLCINKKFKYKNIINLWILVVFYNLLFGFIFNDLGLRLLFPVSSEGYWYFSSYFCFIFFIPFINKYLNSIEKDEYRNLIITLFFVFCIVSYCSKFFKNDSVGLVNGYSSLWLLGLYIVGGYIRKYNFKFKNYKKIVYLLLYLLSSMIVLLSRVIILKVPFFQKYINSQFFISYISIFIVFSSLVLFLLFIKIEIKGKIKFILSYLSNLSFSVYIIHCNSYIYNNFIGGKFYFFSYFNVFGMIFMVLFTALIIYVLCTIIDVFRYYLFKILRVDKFSEMIDEKIVCLLTKKG